MEKYIKIKGKDTHAWIEYIQQNIALNQIGFARQLVKRACEYAKSQDIFQYYIQFEKLFGTLE